VPSIRGIMSTPSDAGGVSRVSIEAGTTRSDRIASLLGDRLYRVALLLFLLAIFYRYFEPIAHVLLIAFVGAILGVAFNAIVTRVPIRRGIATILLAVVLLGTIGTSIYLGISAVVRQLRQLVSDLPAIMATLEGWEQSLQEATGLDLELLGPRTEQLIGGVAGGVSGGAVLAGTFGLLEMVAVSVLVLVGALFVVARPNEQLLNPLIRAVPHQRRPAFRRMFERLGERLSGWLFGTLMSMLIIGGLSAIAFYILGVPYPLLLGLLIGIIDIIPLVGPWIGGAIAVIVTLFHDPALALWVAVTVLVIQEVEGNIVRPLVMSSSAELHPFVTLLALLLFSSIFGLLGAILALPLTLAIATVVEVLWVEETLEAGDEKIQPLVET
jgi:predicted PurR-regulated permease PerM